MSVPWDAPFEEILRGALPRLTDDRPLESELPLDEYGLDSMATIDTLLRVEDHYRVSFPDTALTSVTFATPGNLWAVLSGLRGTAPVTP